MKQAKNLLVFALAVVIALSAITFYSSAAETIEAPTLSLSNEGQNGKIVAKWTKVEGAVSYKLYRADSKDGKYRQIQSTPRREHCDGSSMAGNKYYYKVKAVAEDGTTSKYSEAKFRTADLEQPKIYVSAINTSGKPKVTWDAIYYATAYKVYRAESADGPFKLIKTTTSTSCKNISAEAGKTYYYKVKAICDNRDADSVYSGIKSCSCILPAPVVTASLNSSNKPRLKWEPVEGAVSYMVYRSTTGSDPFKLMKTTTSTSYVNTSAKSGTTYYYKVRAVYSDTWYNSIYSKPIVSITTK